MNSYPEHLVNDAKKINSLGQRERSQTIKELSSFASREEDKIRNVHKDLDEYLEINGVSIEMRQKFAEKMEETAMLCRKWAIAFEQLHDSEEESYGQLRKLFRDYACTYPVYGDFPDKNKVYKLETEDPSSGKKKKKTNNNKKNEKQTK